MTLRQAQEDVIEAEAEIRDINSEIEMYLLKVSEARDQKEEVIIQLKRAKKELRYQEQKDPED